MSLLRIFLASAAIVAVGARSQGAQPANARVSEEVIALSPFTVSDTDDKSWLATTTLIGSRTNQELAKLPVTVDVITAEFMRDLGAFNMEDAAQFVSGVNVTPGARRGFSVNFVDARTRVCDPKPEGAGELGAPGTGFPIVMPAPF